MRRSARDEYLTKRSPAWLLNTSICVRERSSRSLNCAVPCGSVEGVYERLSDVEPEKLRELLRTHEEQARHSREMATIVTDAPVTLNLDECRVERFDREKVLSGLHVACARRPVSAGDLERLVDRVEDHVSQMGKTEIPTRAIGDLVIEELKALDPVSYIRYAIIYLGLEDLEAVRVEVNRLLEEGSHSA